MTGHPQPAQRYRDIIDRELYAAQQKRNANLRTIATTDKTQTAVLCQRLADALTNKIARLEAERTTAPERPREPTSGGFRRSASPLASIGIAYPTAMPSATDADDLVIPAFLRRT